jgi:hypothetical protein
MAFLAPYYLWAAAAVTIPVAIHFWHRQRGKPLPWAATRWLSDNQQQPSRGLRLDNIPLLLLRCAMLLWLALLLSQPILSWLGSEKKPCVVHLVQPNTLVVNNFRFELADAKRKGETVLWATASPIPIQETDGSVATAADINPLVLQTAIDRLPPQTTRLHLYAQNKPALADVPVILLPAPFHLHLLIDSAEKPPSWLLLNNGRTLFVNRAGSLTSRSPADPGLALQPGPVQTGPVRVWLNYGDKLERQTVRAALAALTDVYGLTFAIDEKPTADRPYNLVLTDKSPTRPNPQTLYIVSGTERLAPASHVVYTPDRLTPQTSERVATGQLPEWLGGQLLDHFKLSSSEIPLSQQVLTRLFRPAKKQTASPQAGVQQVILLLLIAAVALERGLALTKNA